MKHENLKRSWFAGFSDFFKMWKHGMGVDLLNLRLSQTLKQKKWKTQISRENGNQLEDLATFSHRGFQPPPPKKMDTSARGSKQDPQQKRGKKSSKILCQSTCHGQLFFWWKIPWEVWSLRCSSWKGGSFWASTGSAVYGSKSWRWKSLKMPLFRWF